jgi:hypothetical protein
MQRALFFVALASCLGLASCGGKTVPESGNGGAGGLATTNGSGTTVGGTTSGGGRMEPTAPSCETVCARLYQTGCYGATLSECVVQCQDLRLKTPMCATIFDDFLRCLVTTPLTCNRSGDMLLPVCDDLNDRFSQCVTPSSPPPIVDAGMGGTCDSMPKPPAGMMCSGSGSSAAATSGGGSPEQCSMLCNDARGNTWGSECVGNSCSCRYNGQEFCRCTTQGPYCLANGCCPIN